MKHKVMLFLSPYFAPWTPPLGISILKSYLEEHGHEVTCYDLNTVPKLWGMHHRYFSELRQIEEVAINDGYSKLWYVLNAHCLAYLNGASPAQCRQLLEAVIPLYGMTADRAVISALLPIVERYFDDLHRILVEEIDLSRFTVVGASTYTTSLSSSLFTLRHAKEVNPGILTVMGGGAFADDLAIGSENLDTLVREYRYVDHMVLGEGEELFLQLLEGKLAHKKVLSISDLDGQTLAMDRIPVPDFSDFDLETYHNLTIEGGRSCPFQCSFCSETTQWGTYRKKPKDLLVGQLSDLAERHDNPIFFMGDSLMDPYIQGLSKELIDRRVEVRYDGYLRADKVASDSRRTRVWSRSGVYRVRLGVESASADVLEKMVKMTTPETISKALRALSSAGIRTTTYWIVGFPGETEENFRETLEFIRDHHRYIYELEAHPYYYYPYGQVGSRFHDCYSLYPPEVVELTKFKIWEIVDAQPSRQEKYDRLRRISNLASELGLPNIYTMADRYLAESRWQRLHPLTREVYEATHEGRERPIPPASPVTVAGWAPVAGDGWVGVRAGYRGELDEAALEAAAGLLVEFNETLGLDHHGDRWAAPASPPAAAVLRRSEPEADAEADPEAAFEIELRRAAAELRPRAGDSVRVLVQRRGEEAWEIAVLAHRAVADARSAGFFLEDLFRGYEQSSAGLPITLQPVERSYLEELGAARQGAEAAVCGELRALDRIRDTATGTAPRGVAVAAAGDGSARLALEAGTVRRIYSEAAAECRLRPVELLVAALRDALPAEVEADVTVDLRSRDEGLERTAGPLTGVAPLGWPEGGSEAFGDPERIRRWLRGLSPGGAPASGAGRVLIDTEAFLEPPWLEGDRWQPGGFLRHGVEPRPGYRLEIAPRSAGDGIELELRWRGSEEWWLPVSELAERLAASLDRLADGWEREALGRRLARELLTGGAAGNFEAERPAAPESAAPFAESPIALDGAVVDRLCEGFGAAPAELLASAFAALVSRLSGNEEVLLLVAGTGGDGAPPVPLRLRAPWSEDFGTFLRRASERAREAAPVADRLLAAVAAEEARPRFDVGFAFAGDVPALPALLASHPRLAAGLDLAVELGRDGDRLAGTVRFREGSGAGQIAERLPEYLESILESIAEAIGSPPTLGDLVVDRGWQSPSVPSSLAAEEFHFSPSGG